MRIGMGLSYTGGFHETVGELADFERAGLDYVSDGRFMLGLGASGPQVIEGFHGVPYDAPISRTREVIEICRQVWRREYLQYRGKHYTIPLPPGQGTGLGKPLKLINQPVRERIPILVAAGVVERHRDFHGASFAEVNGQHPIGPLVEVVLFDRVGNLVGRAGFA